MLERAKELRQLGESARRRDRDAARRCYEEAVAILRDCGEPQLLAHTLRHLGDVYFENGDTPLAGPCFSEALQLYHADPATPRLQLANAIRSMALYQGQVGDQSAARLLWAEAGELYRLEAIQAGVEECEGWLA